MSDEILRLTVSKNPRGPGKLAIVSRGGHPQIPGSGQCEVLTLEIVPSMKAARAWFREVRVTRPWETRQ